MTTAIAVREHPVPFDDGRASAISTFESPRGSHAIRIAAIVPALGTMLRAGIAYFAAVRRTRRTVEILHRLSDWELRDIGLTRSDIRRVARTRPVARSGD